MRTPAGSDCIHYYEDFHRGRAIQECRLASANSSCLQWQPGDCSRCVVPEILAANASKHLELQLSIKSRLLGFGRVVEVQAFCLRHRTPIDDPYVGCSSCNRERPGLDIFRQALQEPEDNDSD